jgi:hypothetical protein
VQPVDLPAVAQRGAGERAVRVAVELELPGARRVVGGELIGQRVPESVHGASGHRHAGDVADRVACESVYAPARALDLGHAVGGVVFVMGRVPRRVGLGSDAVAGVVGERHRLVAELGLRQASA